MAKAPVTEGTQYRDATDGALAVDNNTKSADVRIPLMTPVGTRDEHISIDELGKNFSGSTHTPINRANTTQNVAPTAGEAPSPADKDSATVWLTDGVEQWTHDGTNWSRTSYRALSTAGKTPTAYTVPAATWNAWTDPANPTEAELNAAHATLEADATERIPGNRLDLDTTDRAYTLFDNGWYVTERTITTGGGNLYASDDAARDALFDAGLTEKQSVILESGDEYVALVDIPAGAGVFAGLTEGTEYQLIPHAPNYTTGKYADGANTGFPPTPSNKDIHEVVCSKDPATLPTGRYYYYDATEAADLGFPAAGWYQAGTSPPSTTPVITAIPDQTFNEGDVVNIVPSATNSPTSWAVAGLPAGTGLAFNTTTGALTGTLNAADLAASPSTLTWTATNANGSDTEASLFTITAGTTTAIGSATFATPTFTLASTSTPAAAQTLNLIRYTMTMADPGFPNDGRVIVIAAATHAAAPTVISDTGGTPVGRLTTAMLAGTGASLTFDVAAGTTGNDIVLSAGGTITTTLRVEDTGGGNDTATI